jgi:hypothetical protein
MRVALASAPCEVLDSKALARATPKCANAPVQQFQTIPRWVENILKLGGVTSERPSVIQSEKPFILDGLPLQGDTCWGSERDGDEVHRVGFPADTGDNRAHGE